MINVELQDQSAIHAAAEHHSLQQSLVELDQWGHTVHGLFHSHPGNGGSATRPSSTDLDTHRRYEAGGYPLIGAIFVRCGHVRFFSDQRPFSITIFGNGVETINANEHLYKIDLHDPATRDSRGGCKSDGQTRALVRVSPSESS